MVQIDPAAAAEADDLVLEKVAVLTLEQKVRLLTGADFWSLHPEPAVGLRRLVVSDGPAGVRGETWDERSASANVPSPTALAATWDTTQVERMGRLLAAEARRKGVDVVLAPTVNLHRSPYGGRHFECFSEDPLLTGVVGAAYVRGLQSQGVGATVKHFVANDSETQRFSLDVKVSERALRELYLAPFEVIVRDAGVWSVMAAYNGVNGHTMTESPLLRDVLQEEWGFDGVTMTDWFAGRSLAAADAGLDLLMPGPTGPWGAALVDAVRQARVDEAVVDDKVARLLRLAMRVGALEGVPGVADAVPWSDSDVASALQSTAAAGIVLAKNDAPVGDEDPFLPLDAPSLHRVAVLGPNAAVGRTLGGGSATVFPPHTIEPLAGLQAALPDVEMVYARGGRSTRRVPVATTDLLQRPDGSAGIEVFFLDRDGGTLRTEPRSGAAFTWLGSFGDGLAMADVAAIEVRTRVRAPRTASYLLAASGVGAFRLTVSGEVRAEADLVLPDGADPVEGMMRPPQLVTQLDLLAGEEVDVVLRHDRSAVTAFADVEVPVVSLQLNLEVDGDDETELREAVAAAQAADVAVVVVGTTEEVESEGFDRETLSLPGRQDELIARVVAANPRTVVVVNSGAPVLLPWAGDVPAILLTWFPGQEFGKVLADVLLGAVEPGGRLPVTWPTAEDGLPSTTPVDGVLRYDEDLHIGYRWYDREGRRPRFCFGEGLGYTTWDYLSAAVASDEPATGEKTVSLRVRNTGPRHGREVVQVYASRPDSVIERSVRWLAGWAVVEAGPGQDVTADVTLAPRVFEHWNASSHQWTSEPGTFELQCGHSVTDLPLKVLTDIALPT